MSTVMDTPVKERAKTSPGVGSFGISASHPRNSDLLLRSVIDCRLRSAIRPTKEILVREPGEIDQTLRPAPAKMIDGLPAVIPGMELHVNPVKGQWKVIDPLHDDERLCEKIQRAMEQSTGTRTRERLRGIPPRSGSINPDQMKTLVREMVWLLEAGEATLAAGSQPSLEDVDAMPGDYLNMPVERGGRWHIPRYEKQMDEWVQTLNNLR